MLKTPHGYGQLIDAPFKRPDWIGPEEIVARHLKIGFDERKAKDVPYWHHPFRVRADHPFYPTPAPRASE